MMDNVVEKLREEIAADREYRQLGHRIVWDASGRSNVGLPPLQGEALKTQLERQRRFY